MRSELDATSAVTDDGPTRQSHANRNDTPIDASNLSAYTAAPNEQVRQGLVGGGERADTRTDTALPGRALAQLGHDDGMHMSTDEIQEPQRSDEADVQRRGTEASTQQKQRHKQNEQVFGAAAQTRVSDAGAALVGRRRRPWWRLRLLRIAASVVAKNDFNSGVNLYGGLCGELGNGLAFSAHMDVLRRLNCAVTSSRGALDLAVRLRVNLITFHQTALDVGLCYRPWPVWLPHTELRLAASQGGSHSVSLCMPDCTHELGAAWLQRRRQQRRRRQHRHRVEAAAPQREACGAIMDSVVDEEADAETAAAEGITVHTPPNTHAPPSGLFNGHDSSRGDVPAASDSGHWISFAPTLEAVGQVYDRVYHRAQNSMGAYLPTWQRVSNTKSYGDDMDTKGDGDYIHDPLRGGSSGEGEDADTGLSSSDVNSRTEEGNGMSRRHDSSGTYADAAHVMPLRSPHHVVTMPPGDRVSWRSRLRDVPHRTYSRLGATHRRARSVVHRAWSTVYRLDWLESVLDNSVVDVTVGLTSSKSSQRCGAYSAYVIFSAH